MDDGSAADLDRWIAQVKPWLAERVVFVAGEGDCAVVAPGRPMFRTGVDSRALTTALREIVRPGARRARAVLASNHPG